MTGLDDRAAQDDRALGAGHTGAVRADAGPGCGRCVLLLALVPAAGALQRPRAAPSPGGPAGITS